MKKLLPGIFAIIIAVSLSAFTAPKHHSKKVLTQEWFLFNGTSPGDLNTASKYSVDDVEEPTICTERNHTYRCEIFAMPQSGNPSLPDLATITDETKRDNP